MYVRATGAVRLVRGRTSAPPKRKDATKRLAVRAPESLRGLEASGFRPRPTQLHLQPRLLPPPSLPQLPTTWAPAHHHLHRQRPSTQVVTAAPTSRRLSHL